MQGINVRLRFRLNEILVPETLTAFCAWQKPETFSMGICANRDSCLYKGKCRGVLVYKVALKMCGTLRENAKEFISLVRLKCLTVIRNIVRCYSMFCEQWMGKTCKEAACSPQLKRVIIWLINNGFPHYSVSEVERWASNLRFRLPPRCRPNKWTIECTYKLGYVCLFTCYGKVYSDHP